tara:strand:- start:1343 stop:1621 length:279 start_codon:yes stop_codon:yes gene_type:complete
MSSNLVKGYNGIMDLDLNLVPSKFHKEAVEQHYKDIEEYKAEQYLLPENLRYENTVLKAEKIIKIEKLALQKRIKEKYDEDTKKIERLSNKH